jgi:hypothetical protein
VASRRSPACVLLVGVILTGAALLLISGLADGSTADAKVAPLLREVVQRMRDAGATRERAGVMDLQAFSTPAVHVDREGRVQVYVDVERVDDETLRDLQAAGVAIDLASPRARIVQGWVPFDMIDTVTSLAAVRRIRAPDYALPRSGSPPGPATR